MEEERRGRRRDRDRRILNEMQTFANYWELLPSVRHRNAVKFSFSLL